MKIFEENLEKEFYFPDYITANENLCFLDIETDGLSSTYNKIVLVGLLLYSGSKAKIIQLFCENPAEEKTLLLTLSRLLKSVDTIITYNGSSFDIPFIQKRIQKYKISDFLSPLSHIDLYRRVRRHKDKLNLENCKLKTVERRLGIYREDGITGKESALLYKQYLSSPSHALQKTILKHNYDDIVYLPDILKIEEHLRTSDIISLKSNNRFIKISILMDALKFKRDMLKIHCVSSPLSSADVLCYEDSYTLSWNKASGDISIDLSLESNLLSDGRIAQYLCLSELKIPPDLNKEDFYILAINNSIIEDRLSWLLYQILKNWV